MGGHGDHGVELDDMGVVVMDIAHAVVEPRGTRGLQRQRASRDGQAKKQRQRLPTGEMFKHKNSFRSLSVSARQVGRSEEHTSELQSLMRISYAVFCLKNKKHT